MSVMSFPRRRESNQSPEPMSAEAWFARLHSPDCTKQDEATFDQWLRADPSNAAAYEACEKLSAMSGGLRAHHALVDDLLADAGVGSHSHGQSHSRVGGNPIVRATLAAAATIAAVSVGLYLAIGTSATAPATVVTTKGQQRQLALDDGSKIQLNTDTILDWRITDSERRVTLKQGEAFFDVAKDPRRPFIVRAGSSEVRVVGTQFSVREEAGHLEVVVKEGKVDVVPDSSRATGPAPTKVELTPGKRLSYDNAQNLVRVAIVDPDRSLTWRTGSLDFDSATLEEALAEINRYAAKPLVIDDDRLRVVRLSGRFRLGDTEAVVFTLRERFGIEASETAERIALR